MCFPGKQEPLLGTWSETHSFFRVCVPGKQWPLLGTRSETDRCSLAIHDPTSMMFQFSGHPSSMNDYASSSITHHPPSMMGHQWTIINDPSCILSSFWDDLGLVLGLFWGHVVVMLDNFGAILESFWGHFGSMWGQCGVTLGSRWGHFGISLGSLWGPRQI